MTMVAIHANAPPVGAYTPAVRVGPWLYCSGQIGLLPQGGTLVSSDFKAQLHQAIDNLEQLLKASGGNLEALVKLTVYLLDMNDYAILNEVLLGCLPVLPARSVVAVSALPKGAVVEIDAVAYIENALRQENRE